MTVAEIHYVDYGVQGEYGIFGKTVAKSIVAGMTDEEIKTEIAEMKEILGSHVNAVECEIVGAA